VRHRQAGLPATAAVVALYCIAAVSGAPTVVMVPLGIMLLAAPGYLWGEILIGSRVSGLERVAVAAGLALVLPVVGGVVLRLGGFPLHQAAWVGLLACVTLVGDVVLLVRGMPPGKDRAGQAESGPGGTAGKGPGQGAGRAGDPSAVWRSRARHIPARHVIAFGAAVVIAAAGVGIARWGAAAQHYPGFTQLWLAPPGGSHPGAQELAVSNHQGATMRYRLVLDRHGHTAASWDIILADGQTWRRAVAGAGGSRIKASLYRLPDLAHPYRQVYTARGRGASS
jgi:hypothetical protein